MNTVSCKSAVNNRSVGQPTHGVVAMSIFTADAVRFFAYCIFYYFYFYFTKKTENGKSKVNVA